MKKQTSQTQATPPDELETSATDLMVLIENGHADEVPARIQSLSQRDFISILRSVQALEKALNNYALSWENAEYWGNGQPFPDEKKAGACAA